MKWCLKQTLISAFKHQFNLFSFSILLYAPIGLSISQIAHIYPQFDLATNPTFKKKNEWMYTWNGYLSCYIFVFSAILCYNMLLWAAMCLSVCIHISENTNCEALPHEGRFWRVPNCWRWPSCRWHPEQLWQCGTPLVKFLVAFIIFIFHIWLWNILKWPLYPRKHS